MARIGFIGVGVMGAPIAQRLVDASHAVTVCDRNGLALEPFAKQQGVRVAATPADCANAEVIFVLVLSAGQVRDVVAGEGGIVTAIDPERAPTVVIMSTVPPATVREMQARLAPHGARLVDAPVSGGLDGARRGTLSIMAGGDRQDIERIRPLLEIVGSKIAHCGPVGAGVTTKIINNLIGVANWLLTAEAMATASALGLDLGALARIMENGSGRNIATRDWASREALYKAYAADPAMLAANVDICRKDLALAVDLAASAGVALPLTEGLRRVVDGASAEALASVWQEIARSPPASPAPPRDSREC